MFGHDDNKKNDHDIPQHDGVLGDGPQQHDNHGSENTDSPAFIMGAPAQDQPTDHPTTPPASAPASKDTKNEDGLLDIKQDALKQLSPLVGHLNQTPEEKFRTTMMMIQASDDKSLIKDAYEAAQAIGDEKTKAQALLDIINEINYFTQQN